ncbi:uncharacterized protein At1g24485-like [Nymphaea colorata]|nr:uncharacterized protein At1g24485-like [Nymphaea colorata]
MRPLSLLLFLALHAALVSGASVNIACGRADSFTDDDGAEWIGDRDYINIGTAGKVAGNSSLSEPLTHLRYFPGFMTACYNLTGMAIAGGMVTVTTNFYYGNYDGTNRPPEFRVRYDNYTWKNVVTSYNTVTYPLTFVAESGNINICLGVPAGDHKNTAFVNTIQLEGSVRAISTEDGLKRKLLQPWAILICLVVFLVMLALLSVCCCCCCCC